MFSAYTKERRNERKLIRDYEILMEEILANLRRTIMR